MKIKSVETKVCFSGTIKISISLICPICLSSKKRNVYILKCNHCICLECLDCNVQNSCPLCRSIYNVKQVKKKKVILPKKLVVEKSSTFSSSLDSVVSFLNKQTDFLFYKQNIISTFDCGKSFKKIFGPFKIRAAVVTDDDEKNGSL